MQTLTDQINDFRLGLQSASPIIKWAGGKSWLVKEHGEVIRRRVMAGSGRYVEPFLGGGAMAFFVANVATELRLGDALSPLVDMYRTVRENPLGVWLALEALCSIGLDEKSYYQVREWAPVRADDAAARFIYLNKVGYNGLYRENKSGRFNVPYGKQRRKAGPGIPSALSLWRVSVALERAEIRCGDFAPTLDTARRGDVAFCDPPYDGVDFTAYTAGGFAEDDQRRLADAVAEAVSRGATVFITNSDTELVRELYRDYEIVPTSERRAINGDGEKRGGVPCVLVVADGAK